MKKVEQIYKSDTAEPFSLFNKYCLSPKNNLCSTLLQQDKKEPDSKICSECIWTKKGI